MPDRRPTSPAPTSIGRRRAAARRFALAWSVLGLIAAFPATAQGPGASSDAASDPDEEPVELSDEQVVEALALYPPETQEAILAASMHPEPIERIAAMQERSSTGFREIIEPLPREAQEQAYDLTRFPGLVDRLIEIGGGSQEAIAAALEDEPEAVRANAAAFAASHFETLEAIQALGHEVEADVELLIARQPEDAQASLRALLELPEVLTTLADRPDLTRRLGTVYAADPKGTLERLAKHAAEIEAREQAAIDDWERALNEDPEAARELQASAEAFAQEEGLDTAIEAPDEEEVENATGQPTSTRVTVNYYSYPYRYWYGVPWWYHRYYWYRRPWYYHTGYYYRPGRVVVIGTGSYRFARWHYSRPELHSRYPHLHARYIDHAQRHPRYQGGSSLASREWLRERRDLLPSDWARSDGKLPERFQELGRFEQRYAEANRERPQTREEFLRTSPERFEGLSDARRPQARPAERPQARPGELPQARPGDRPSPATREADLPATRPAPTTRDTPTTRDVPQARDAPRPDTRDRAAPRPGTQRPSDRSVSRGRTPDTIRRDSARDNHAGSWRTAPAPRRQPMPSRGGARPRPGGGAGRRR